MSGTTRQRPHFAAFRRKARKDMDIILHLGAHRTASTSFQFYLRENADVLTASGIGFWGPWRTRDGLLTGVVPVPGRGPAARQFQRAQGRIALQLEKARARGLKHLIVSDENMLGACRRNLRFRRLYAAAGERAARFGDAFGGQVTRVVLCPRSQDTYWASALAFSVGRGHRVPETDDLDRLVTANRHWRDVVTDIACALPGVEFLVMPYECFGGRPEVKLARATGLAAPPRHHAREWTNRAPSLRQLRKILNDRGADPACLPEGDGRWHPFNRDQTMALREAYADDMYWLRAGADGLATLIEETGPVKAGQQPPIGQTTRGHPNGIEERRLA